ncbi:AST [Ectocarpus sp. CCAP 1310/34]|nr:AST [Ectocarpus sp. CCAP 1310/34]
MSSTTPFRELGGRAKVSLPAWELRKDKEEVKYVLKVCRGVPQNDAHDEESLNSLIDTFETRDSDVFVCTYVKSGTTWTQQIINLLRNKGEDGDDTYAEAVPWLEAALFGGKLGEKEATNWTLDKIVANSDKRFFKTHANLKDLPCGKAPGVKVIYVCRNPKDVCVSLQHHATNKPMFQYTGDFSDMLTFFAEGRCENGSWFDHVLEWHEASKADPEHVIFLRYEDILADPPTYVKKIADFVGIETTPEIIEKTVAASTISAMKSSANANTQKEVNHLRKGGAGGWRDVFKVRESEAFDRLYREQMKGSGLEMDFGEGLSM